MQGVVDYLKDLQLHPFVDHFTVALVLVAILVDFFASLLASRLWLRSMATTLLVFGALAAIGSKYTGGWEAHRVWDSLSAPAKDALKWHAEVGDYLAPIIAGLAVWRLALQFFSFMARTRAIYLIIAAVTAGGILYQGDIGGDLVYEYGIGTAASAKESPIAAQSPGTNAMPTPIPTVYVPPPPPAVRSSMSSSAAVPSAATSPLASGPESSGPAPSPVAATPEASPMESPPAAKSTTL